MAESLISNIMSFSIKLDHNKITKNGIKMLMSNQTFKKLTLLHLSNLTLIEDGNSIGSMGIKYLIKLELPNMK